MNQNSKLKIAFLGTPEIAATILSDLLGLGVNISAVITQPDRPCGRGKIMQESSVKSLAIESHIPIYQPNDKSELTAVIKEINPDICLVAAYGMIIPNEALDVPKYGMINFHPSLLPLYRGSSPITEPILSGDTKTGVTIIQISEAMDAGDILSQEEIALKGTETTPKLSERLAHLGAEMIADLLPKIISQGITPKKQDDSKATYVKMLKKEDGRIDWQNMSAEKIERMSRAYLPWPGIYTTWNGKRLNLFDIKFLKGLNPQEGSTLLAGKVVEHQNKIAIGTAKGTILVGVLQLEGKSKVPSMEFLRGYRDFLGTVLK